MYNSYKIFHWNHDHNNIVNNNNIYNDVFINTGTRKHHEWENTICVTYLNDKPKVIKNSHHFLTLNESSWQNQEYKIYDNLVRNYIEITENKVSNNDYYHLDNAFYMIDAFIFSNSGHNLSIMLDNVNYIITNNIKDILIIKGYSETHNYKLIKLLLPNDIIFHELELNTIYKIKQVHIIYPEFFNIFKHMYLIEKLQNIIKDQYSIQYDEYKNKNVILMKTNRNENIFYSATQYHCESFVQSLEAKGYIYLYPEKIDIFKLATYLLFANKIVFSTGSILYTNKIFFTERSKLIYVTTHNNLNVCMEGVHERSPLILYVNNTNIDSNDYIELVNRIDNY